MEHCTVDQNEQLADGGDKLIDKQGSNLQPLGRSKQTDGTQLALAGGPE